MKPVVLVTGSSGLIGTRVCQALAANYTVVGLDREGAPHPPDEAEWLFVDMTSDESMQLAFHLAESRYGNSVASVVHLAAYYNFAGGDPRKYDEINVKGSERLLRELRRFHVDQMIYAGSMVEHKPVEPGEVITEESPMEPTWEYPESKIKTEELLLDSERNFKLVILRIAGVYDQMCNSIPLSHQIQRIYENKLTSHFYPGDLEVGQSFVHLDDVVDAFVLAVERRNELPDGSAFLIGEENVLSYGRLQDEIGRLLYGHEWPTAEIPKPIAKAGAWVQDKVSESFIKPWMVDRADDHYALDATKAKTELGWQPKHELSKVLPEMIENLKKDPDAWYKANRLELKRRSA